MVDDLANSFYSSAFSYTDDMECLGDSVFSSDDMPDGATITDPGNCAQPFSVFITDAEGIDFVRVKYSINDDTFASPLLSPPLANTDDNFYEGAVDMDSTSVTPPTTVYFVFYVGDFSANTTYFPDISTPYSLTDNVGCDGTTTSIP